MVGNKWKFWVSTSFEISLTLPWIVQPAMLAAVVTKQSVFVVWFVWFTCNKCRNIWLIIGQHYYMRVWSYWRTYITNMYVVDNLLWLEKNYTHDRIIGQAFFGFWIHSKNVLRTAKNHFSLPFSQLTLSLDVKWTAYLSLTFPFSLYSLFIWHLIIMSAACTYVRLIWLLFCGVYK